VDDDEALLQRELHWRSRPGDRRRPAGSNAITAIGLVLTLVMWGVTTAVLRAVFSGSPEINPSAILFIAFAVEMFVAAVVAGRVWVAIGPGPRGLLRPFGVLGPFPMLIIGFFVFLAFASHIAAPFLPRTPRPVAKGRNWHFAKTAHYGATYAEALELCRQQPGEKVPSFDEIALFDPPFPRDRPVWLERTADMKPNSFLSPEGKISNYITRRPDQPVHTFVVCFRP
jgi:hypothetical protein